MRCYRRWVPDTGAFTAPPRRHAARAAGPRPLPIDERVFPPRPPDAPRIPLQDSSPLPSPSGARPASGWPGSTRAWARAWSAGWNGTTGRRRPGTQGTRRVRRKSVVLAAVLGFVFGPVGMLYASAKAAVAALITGTAVFVLTLAITLEVTDLGNAFLLAVLQLLMVGPVCALWAAVAASLRNRTLPPA